MPVVYYKGGFWWRYEPDENYVAQDGEILTEYTVSDAELNAMFPNRAAYIEACSRNHSEWYDLVGVEWVLNVANVAASQVQDLHKSADSALSVYTGYPTTEVAGWGTLRTEAERYLADNTYQSILLNAAVAASDGVWSLPSYAQLIIAKSDLFLAAYGTAMGQRAKSEADIAAIVATLSADPDDAAAISALLYFDTSVSVS